MSDLVTYAYAVVRNAAGLDESTAVLTGVADAPVHLVTGTQSDEIVLVVSPVPVQDFHEDALKRHLEDLEWLEAVARAHNRVIDALATRTTVLPLRLATVYLDDTRARDVLDGGRDDFRERLARLAEHVEWGVKIYVDPSMAPAAPEPPAAAGLTPGRAYLRSRRKQQSVRDSAYRAAEQAAQRVQAVGRAYAAGRACHRVQQGPLADGVGGNVVNDAYLVPRNRTEEFRSEAEHAADGLEGVRVEVTGPWAPYSFAMPAQGSGGAAEGVSS
ncbi:GvpL/GvpF family gas vesicle protein [Streptomyces sp. NPDC005408]|uniref:GvpL/GvpF family gas vesicle protein n=1 Tax=Streptomyces sp. NPDC005408 TaxID=3155341 RepID=UPI0033BA7C22